MVILLGSLGPLMMICTYMGYKDTARKFPKVFAKIQLMLMGVRIKVKGRDKIDFTAQHIYVMNHSSNIDPFILLSEIPSNAKILAKTEIRSYPVYGFAVKHLYLTVDRSDKKDRMRSMEVMTKALNAGDSLMLFPEGTRNRTENAVTDFKIGAFVLSQKTGVPIAMLSSVNSREIVPTNSYLARPGVIRAYWDGPFYPDKYDENEVEKYREDMRNFMQNRIQTG